MDGPHKTAGHLWDTPRTRVPLAAAGIQSALYVYIQAYQCIDMCMDKSIDMCLDLCMGMCIDMCADIWAILY